MTKSPRQNLGTFPAVLLFGSLALSFDDAAFHQLRKSVTEKANLTWLLDALLNLGDDCGKVFAAVPALKQPHIRDQLLDLRDALTTSRSLRVADRLPSTVLIPLVVASHQAQYAALLESTDMTHDEYIVAGDVETLGLCTGLLGAFAVAGSHTQAELEKNGAVAVRLGMLIGLVIDQTDALSPSKSLSVGWSSSEPHDAVIQTLKKVPSAYTSVTYDENRITVTAAALAIPQLQSRLRALGLTASEISLHGRFHTLENSEIFEHLLEFCEKHPDFQLPDGSSVAIPTRSDDPSGKRVTQGALHAHALRAILVDSPSWHNILSSACAEKGYSTVLLSFGTERCVPPSVLRKAGVRLVHLADQTSENTGSKTEQIYSERPWRDEDIAVVGMACKLPGANDVAEFWDLLASAKPQHQEIGIGHPRFDFSDSLTRSAEDPGMRRRWFANLVSDADQFDHKFFMKNPRESAAMDPAQRLLLQVAYQAVEQSGYLNGNGASDGNVGVFLGTTGNDYQANAASQAANAFTTTGNLQGFLAGKVSHYFGWTGPAMVVDTACNGSLVAIHQACTALVSGECSAALAGGANILTQPAWFQNLAAGQFLSPTGQCKPFDAAADGYCRSEGVGAVFLKRMDRAVADGDSILGVIAATAVQQNQNCTPIFVPNVPSLGSLFHTVVAKARVKKSQISVVEAHGTGTAVGDPAEYASIKAELGGSNRTVERPLLVSSLKGLIGHLEGTSGVVALIKLLLMLRVGMVPPQASFTTINPAIAATPADNMIIPTRMQQWDADFRIALINNYGASGSNASMVLAQPPMLRAIRTNRMPAEVKYAFWLSAHDNDGLHRRARALRSYLDRVRDQHSLANLSYNVARQSNRALKSRTLFSVTSLDELDRKLLTLDKGETRPTDDRAIVLCFGGQVSTFVGLDRLVYERVTILRKHIDRVDSVARSLGVSSIFPSIFQRTPIQDTVLLQVALLAMQYACARSWLDSGLKPVAVVGHSFGELTALCISQVLSLEDTIKMIINRATLVRDAWGADKGSMMAISEADLSDVQRLLLEANSKHDASPAGIACYNGPRSFTLAGSTTAIDVVAETLASYSLKGIKMKKLSVSNAFHCALVDDIAAGLEGGAQGLTFREPVIPIERATENSASTSKLRPKFVADHMRNPVYFHHALKRTVAKHAASPLVFLEAGSNSTITQMASRALSDVALKEAHFQAVNITNCDDGWNRLVDTTLGLWRAGVAVHHWAHHPLQARESTDLNPLLLPPYQFDPDSRHWIHLKIPPRFAPALPAQDGALPTSVNKKPEEEGLVVFAGYKDGSAQRIPRFRINRSSPIFKKLLAGHMTIQTAPICPATVQIGLVAEGLATIHPVYNQEGYTPQFQDIKYHSPVCASSTLTTWIEVTEEGPEGVSTGAWQFEVFSTEIKEAGNKGAKMLHTTGRVIFMRASDASLQRELDYFPRMFGHSRATDLLTRPDVDEILSHRNIYRMFAEIVDYGEEYRGLRKLVGRGNEAAGVVVPTSGSKRHTGGLNFDPHLSDAFCQVAGVWANFLSARAPSDAYLANGIGQWIRAPAKDTTPAELHVFATSHRSSEKVWLSDVFVFDAADGSLLEVMLGIAFVQISKSSMGKLLCRMSDPRWLASHIATPTTSDVVPVSDAKPIHESKQPVTTALSPAQGEAKAATKAPKEGNGISERVKAIIADLSGLESHEIKADSELADLGIDSLVSMELINELEAAFEIKLPEIEIQAVTDVPGLMKCIIGVLEDDSDVSDEEGSGASTPDIAQKDTGRSTPESFDLVEIEGCMAALPFDAVMDAFNDIKALTDKRVAEAKQMHYVAEALPLQEELAVALALEAFEERGAGIRDAEYGQRLTRISHEAEHKQLVTSLYRMLEALSQIIKMDGDDNITRTAVPLPHRSSSAVYEELAARFPDQQVADKLTNYVGANLARVLLGVADGTELIFGTTEGRELATSFYRDWPLNRAAYAGLEDFLSRLVTRLRVSNAGFSLENPLRILELGAGMGGMAGRLAPLLAKLGLPVQYTFTDPSPSLVSQASKMWSRQYGFMRFATYDMEIPPETELVGTQHLVIAGHAVHATRSLRDSTHRIHGMLRRDGFLCAVELTRPPHWADLIFGLSEGWRRHDDGREHVNVREKRWEADLQASGYGHVDWIDGMREESKILKVIIAAANPDRRCERVSIPPTSANHQQQNGVSFDYEEREQVVARYVTELTADWDKPLLASNSHPANRLRTKDLGQCVLITGGTGGLGSHLVAKALARRNVTRVVCLNRRNQKQEAFQRQMESLVQKGTGVSPDDISDRIDVFETDLSKLNLGLSDESYDKLVNTVTHIVHNAWLMHSKWPVKRFEPQLRIMANMIGLARDISVRRGPGIPVTFEFVSSIAAVGHHPIWTGQPVVPEARVPIQSVLATGYGDAKYACERLIDATLHCYPQRFRAAAVRLGQIAGSSINGYWNHTEHVSFLVKSSQTLGALPDFRGSLGWTPVDDIAGTLVDILLQPTCEVRLHPIYHIENPVRQPWNHMIDMLAKTLDIPAVIPFEDWVRRVRQWPIQGDNSAEGANPAYLLSDFLDDNFERISCGGLLMGTAKAREHSSTLANVGPVSEDVVKLFISKWKEMGFLK